MKAIFTLTFTVFCILSNVSGHSVTLYDMYNPNFPGQCYLHNLELAVPVGRTVQGNCVRYSCDRHFTVVVEVCDPLRPIQGCRKRPLDGRKPYPECCPRYYC